MKYTKKHTERIHHKWRPNLLWIAALLFVISACSDNALLTEQQPESAEPEISKIDGQPIVQIQDADFYGNEQLEQFREKLAASHGRAIIQALNEQTDLSSAQQTPSIAVKDLAGYTSVKGNSAASSAPNIGSTHLRIHEDDGETEDMVLTMRPYYKNPQQVAGKGTGANQLSAANTYLVYSPDRFYLQDDDNGNEQWPVTIPAVSLDDPNDKITVTFNKDGLVSTSLDQEKSNSQSAEPQLVMMDGTSACDGGTAIDDCYDDGGGGGTGGDGSGLYCTEVSGRGGDTGNDSNVGNRTFFVINSMRLWATGDGDGAAELQIFVKRDDDYDGECFPRSYKYRFDTVFRRSPITGQYDDHTIIKGADHKDSPEDYHYQLPDINHDDITYNFNVTRYEYYPLANYWDDEFVDYFPLFDLTNRPGPWRMVASDDDKDYRDFSRRQQSDFAQDIWTYDMANGNWSEVFTGFSTDRKDNGSSDDPIRESGVRRITEDNAFDRLSGGSIEATKFYTGGRFTYDFSLRSY